MPISLFNIQPLLNPIAGNALILTPNSRLRNKLVEAYNQHRSAATPTDKVWPAARVYSINEWISETYAHLLDRGAVELPLSIADEFCQTQLWLRVIESDSAGAELINPLKLAADAHTAYKTLIKWDLNPTDLKAQDGLALEQWSTHFEQLLAASDLTTHEQVHRLICELLENKTQAGETALCMVGFDDIPPLTQRLFDALSDDQSKIDPLPKEKASAGSIESFGSKEEEILAAAEWSLSILSSNPDAVIGIISPELGQIRSLTERTFIEVFEPHFSLPETPRYTLPFNFSAGVPLGSTPFVRDTLQLLQLNGYRNPIERLRNILMSPFWSIAEPIALILDNQLAQHIRDDLKTSQLRHMVHTHSQKNWEQPSLTEQWQTLNAQLQDIETLSRQQAPSMPASRWAALYESQLRKLGWPGDRRLDSNEYQQMNQWYELLEKFCFLDQLDLPLTNHEALDKLGQLASGVHFQPQTPESPIQILGILEGSGLQFTHCWVMGMSQQCWPPTAEPNPLIPLQLQRKLAMPHADADRELLYAERLTQGYSRCATEVIFSYATTAEGNPQHKSPLLESFEEKPVKPPALSQWQRYKNSNTSTLEWVNTGTAPAVGKDELKKLRGGSQIFKNQAISPFAAFALQRLGAQSPQQKATGFTAIQRGDILHNALSDIWLKLQSQQKLKETSTQHLRQLIEECVVKHVKTITRKEPDVFGDVYTQLEIERQIRLISQWLDLEKQRTPFTVAANEESVEVEFAGIPLKLRLDRMDKLSSGELVLIDFKTGTPHPKQWGTDRPEEPQLPLYCLCYNADIDAIMFAQINTTEIACKGLGVLPTPIEGLLDAAKGDSLSLPTDWQEIQQHWRQSLENLAQEFLQGDCSLEFKSPTSKRFYQQLAPIMRWHEEDDIRQAYLNNQAQGDMH
ncbi:MAG: hypothetical protein CL693_09535 [Cellvibrionaceae bacterium]|nr:hypothetical protein [Cellvibrionaceae bacterium]